jgi:hypothetical protein
LTPCSKRNPFERALSFGILLLSFGNKQISTNSFISVFGKWYTLLQFQMIKTKFTKVQQLLEIKKGPK